MKPTIRIHNVETNEVIDREMTDAEFENLEAAKLAEKVEDNLKTAKRAAILDKLGITEEEARLLLG